jgi:hypothetical protein
MAKDVIHISEAEAATTNVGGWATLYESRVGAGPFVILFSP